MAKKKDVIALPSRPLRKKDKLEAILKNIEWIRLEACNDFLGTGSDGKWADKQEDEWNAVFDKTVEMIKEL